MNCSECWGVNPDAHDGLSVLCTSLSPVAVPQRRKDQCCLWRYRISVLTFAPQQPRLLSLKNNNHDKKNTEKYTNRVDFVLLQDDQISVQFSSLSHVWLFVTPWTAAQQASLSITTPGVYSNSCPLSWWCHPAISSSVVPFCWLQSLPAWGSFQMSQFFASGSQSIGIWASATVLPMDIQDWFPLGLPGWISL